MPVSRLAFAWWGPMGHTHTRALQAQHGAQHAEHGMGRMPDATPNACTSKPYLTLHPINPRALQARSELSRCPHLTSPPQVLAPSLHKFAYLRQLCQLLLLSGLPARSAALSYRAPVFSIPACQAFTCRFVTPCAACLAGWLAGWLRASMQPPLPHSSLERSPHLLAYTCC